MQNALRNAVGFFTDPSVSLWSRAWGILALLYVVSPVDAIPDVIPLLGWLDDIGVLAAVATWYMRRITTHVRAGRERDVTPQRVPELQGRL